MADARWIWLRNFRVTCTRPKIGSLSWRRRPRPISKEPSERSSGFTESMRKLKIDFCGSATRAPRPEPADSPIINYWFACGDPPLQDRELKYTAYADRAQMPS